MLYLNYNEKRAHGTGDFPLAFYHVDCDHPRYQMPFHWHREYEIVRILKGSFRLTVDEQEILMESGDSAIIPSGAAHGGIPCQCVYECIVFDLDLLFILADRCRGYLKRIKRQEVLLPLHIAKDLPFLPEIIGRLFSCAAASAHGYELMCVGCLFELFGAVFRENCYTEGSGASEAPLSHARQLKSVFEYIENNFSSSITLSQLSQISGMSPKYFCRYFQTIAHKTPIDYLNYYRIERSCSLLCTTDLPVTAIAYDCGFNDCSYFIRLFKRYKHTTPKQYQLQMRPSYGTGRSHRPDSEKAPPDP